MKVKYINIEKQNFIYLPFSCFHLPVSVVHNCLLLAYSVFFLYVYFLCPLQKCWSFDVLLFMVFRSSPTNGFYHLLFILLLLTLFTVSVFYFITIIYKYSLNSSIVRFRKALNERFLALMEWKSHKEIAFDFIWENSHRNTVSSQVRLGFKKKVNEIYLFSFASVFFTPSLRCLNLISFLFIYSIFQPSTYRFHSEFCEFSWIEFRAKTKQKTSCPSKRKNNSL